jgi:hypothetical protein
MEKIGGEFLAGQAEEHWKRYLPSMYKKLKEAGTLEEEAMNAGTRAADMIEGLIAGGLYPFEAREFVLPQYILLTPEAENEKDFESIQDDFPQSNIENCIIGS